MQHKKITLKTARTLKISWKNKFMQKKLRHTHTFTFSYINTYNHTHNHTQSQLI